MSAHGELPSQFGRYRILRELGAGGMGAVYLAEDPQLNRRVALKVPHFEPSDGPQVLQRFLREAQIVAGIRHEHICLVYDLGQSDGTHFLIMEYVEGASLAHQLAEGQPYEPRAAVELLRKLALAVHVLHTHDVIHRDLKPSNILVRPNGEPVLLDFGLARPWSPQDQGLTATGTLLGTPAYMSPEQVRAEKDIGPATDIYSLGVILYELLAGERPFPGPSFGELAAQILYGKLEPPSRLRPGLDAALDAICMKAMARKAGERYASAQEFATALAAYLQTRSAAPAPAEVVTVPPQVTVICPACEAKIAPPRGVSAPRWLICSACLAESRKLEQKVTGYHLLRELGSGGMGVVYLALHQEQGSIMALKMLTQSLAASTVRIRCFLREAQIMRELNHPHIVAYRNIGECESKPYFVMEYVRGTDAGRLLKQNGPLAVGRAVTLVCQLLDALEYVHGKKHVHRNLKPSKLLVTEERGHEVVKLADMGQVIEYADTEGDDFRNDCINVGGSAIFMPPEQITDCFNVKPPSDQYSAAATLYNLLTGEYVYDFPVAGYEQLMLILDEKKAPIPIQERRRNLPKGLPEVIHRALMREPEERYPDVRAMRQALLKFCS